MDGGHVGGCPHRLELLGVFILADVLGLVYFQQDVGRVASWKEKWQSDKEPARCAVRFSAWLPVNQATALVAI